MDRDRIDARSEYLNKFAWIGDEADTWAPLLNARTLALVCRALANPWRRAGITHVAAIEARGFVLGGAVALALDAGFIPLRKFGGHLPAPVESTATEPDWKGLVTELAVQNRPTLQGAVVLIYDDWIETGSHVAAAQHLLRRAGAHIAGTSVIIDELDSTMRTHIGRLESILSGDDVARLRTATPSEAERNHA